MNFVKGGMWVPYFSFIYAYSLMHFLCHIFLGYLYH
jgi:hypothetical protein